MTDALQAYTTRWPRDRLFGSLLLFELAIACQRMSRQADGMRIATVDGPQGVIVAMMPRFAVLTTAARMGSPTN